MRKLLLTSIIAITAIASTYARVIEEITVDGRDRTYAYYEPTTSNNRVVFLLHGLGETYDDYDATAIQNFANKNKCTVVMPQALPEKDQILMGLLSMAGDDFKPLRDALNQSAWGANVYVRVQDLDASIQSMLQVFAPTYYEAGKLQINKDVNDRNFINNLITLFRANSSTKFYIVGCSLGGAMAYDMGFNYSERLTKIASISGFVSKGVKIPASYNLPTLAINSLTDEIVNFTGGLFNAHVGLFFRAVAENQGVRYMTETILNEDQPEDKQIHLYDWASAPHDRFYVVNQAKHNLFDDMAALGYNVFDIVGDFLFDTHTAADEATADSKRLVIYPNPVEDIANVSIDGKYEIFNLAGVKVASGDTENGTIDMTSLIAGRYILMLTSGNDVYRSIIIKK